MNTKLYALASCLGGISTLALAWLFPGTAAAGPQDVRGPGVDPACFASRDGSVKYLQYPAKTGGLRLALVNGYVGNTWRIQMIRTAKAYTAQPAVAAKLKEFKVVSTGEDVPAQISAVNNFIDAGGKQRIHGTLNQGLPAKTHQ